MTVVEHPEATEKHQSENKKKSSFFFDEEDTVCI